MNNELAPYAIALIAVLTIVQLSLHTRKATRQRILAGTRKAMAWAFKRGDRFLHVFLMSPDKPR